MKQMTTSINLVTKIYPKPLKETRGNETYDNDISLIWVLFYNKIPIYFTGRQEERPICRNLSRGDACQKKR